MILRTSQENSSFGQKAATLIRLRNFGINVPDFLVLSQEDFDRKSGIPNPSLYSKIKELHSNYFAIRSSSNIEDSLTASCAGIFHTELNVCMKDLPAAIKKVGCLSLEAKRKLAKYSLLKSKDYTISVIIQKQIESDFSGVCISRPDDSSNSLYIESCMGLCHSLTDGLITPSYCYVERDSLNVIINHMTFQEKITTCNRDGGITTTTLPDESNMFKLSNSLAVEIAKEVMKIEKELGFYSIDVEWTYCNGVLYILQARPFIQL